jgi:putative FmdB family regulatory protein
VCNTAFDIHQEFTDSSLTVCPSCGGALRKLFSAVGVSFTGSGFYRNDARAEAGASKSSNGSNGSNGSGGSGAGAQAAESTNKETKTEKVSAPAASSSATPPASAPAAKPTSGTSSS